MANVIWICPNDATHSVVEGAVTRELRCVGERFTIEVIVDSKHVCQKCRVSAVPMNALEAAELIVEHAERAERIIEQGNR